MNAAVFAPEIALFALAVLVLLVGLAQRGSQSSRK